MNARSHLVAKKNKKQILKKQFIQDIVDHQQVYFNEPDAYVYTGARASYAKKRNHLVETRAGTSLVERKSNGCLYL